MCEGVINFDVVVISFRLDFDGRRWYVSAHWALLCYHLLYDRRRIKGALAPFVSLLSYWRRLYYKRPLGACSSAFYCKIRWYCRCAFYSAACCIRRDYISAHVVGAYRISSYIVGCVVEGAAMIGSYLIVGCSIIMRPLGA